MEVRIFSPTEETVHEIMMDRANKFLDSILVDYSLKIRENECPGAYFDRLEFFGSTHALQYLQPDERSAFTSFLNHLSEFYIQAGIRQNRHEHPVHHFHRLNRLMNTPQIHNFPRVIFDTFVDIVYQLDPYGRISKITKESTANIVEGSNHNH